MRSRRRTRRGAPWARPLFSLFALFLLPAPAAGQEVGAPSVALVPFIELNFRGERAQTREGDSVDFSNGPAFGVGLSSWLSGTFGLNLRGSYARTEHCVSRPITGAFCIGGDVTLWRGMVELAFRVKPRVPGYFLIGGGVTRVSEDVPEEGGAVSGGSEVEPTFAAAAGLDLPVGRSAFARFELRFYVQVPASDEQAVLEVNSTQKDVAVNVGFGYRL